MKIGLVGYQGSGKSTLFHWLTGQAPDPAQAHTGQSAMAAVPDARIEGLCELYHPKKVTRAALELVDTPGLSRSHEGNAARLALIREAECFVLVVAGFAGSDPRQDLAAFGEDLLLADLEIVNGRVERLRESVKKPRPSRAQEQAELEALEPLLAALEEGKSAREADMTEEQRKATRSFRLLTEKPTFVVVNAADDTPAESPTQREDGTWMAVVPAGLELELERMSPEDREEFAAEMGVTPGLKDELIRTILDVSGQFLYFTAGEKEVRSWMLEKGGTALAAADNIHSDLARGFIRAEIIPCDELIKAGSEREAKAQSLYRQEPKDYIMQDGDVLLVKFNV